MDALSETKTAYPTDRYDKGFHDGLCAALEAVVHSYRHKPASTPDVVEIIETLIENSDE